MGTPCYRCDCKVDCSICWNTAKEQVEHDCDDDTVGVVGIAVHNDDAGDDTSVGNYGDCATYKAQQVLDWHPPLQ